MPGKHQHFQEPEVGCCGKYFLFGFNIVFWVSRVGSGPCAVGDGRRFSPPLGIDHTLPQRLGTVSPFLPPHPYLHAHPQDHQEELLGNPDCRGAGPSYPWDGMGSLPVSSQGPAEKGQCFLKRPQGHAWCGSPSLLLSPL